MSRRDNFNGPGHGPPPVPTYIYTGCYTDWVQTLVTTISYLLWHLNGSLTCPSAMPYRHAVYGNYRVCDGGWQHRESRWRNHIVKSLCEADTQPIKGVLVITGEARKWAIQIGTFIKLRSNYTYSDTSKCISNGNMVLTLREEPTPTV